MLFPNSRGDKAAANLRLTDFNTDTVETILMIYILNIHTSVGGCDRTTLPSTTHTPVRSFYYYYSTPSRPPNRILHSPLTTTAPRP